MRNLLWLIALLLPGITYAQVVPYFPPPGLTYDFAGNLGVTSLLVNGLAGGGVTQYELNNRSQVTTFPAGFVRPETANSVMAFDVMPNGTPVEQSGNGFAWADVCDTDSATTNPAQHCLRIGATSTGMEVGSRDFQGAGELPLLITVHETTVMTCHSSGCVSNFTLTSSPTSGNGVNINQATGTSAGLRIAGAAGDAASIALIDGGTGNTGWVTLSGNPSAGVFALYDQTTAKYLMQGTTAGVPEFPNVASATGATSGYVCFTSSTGAISYDPTNTCLVSSDEFKEDVTPLEGGLAEIERMQPVSFRYKPGDKALSVLGVQLGFTAESIAAIDPRLAAFDPATGKPRSVQYDRVSVVLTLAVQEQQREIKGLAVSILALSFWCAYLSYLTVRRRHS